MDRKTVIVTCHLITKYSVYLGFVTSDARASELQQLANT